MVIRLMQQVQTSLVLYGGLHKSNLTVSGKAASEREREREREREMEGPRGIVSCSDPLTQGTEGGEFHKGGR